MAISDSVRTLERELRDVFGDRLQSLTIYGQRAQGATHGHDAPAIRTLAIVDAMTSADLRACALRGESWNAAGLATPLLIASQEFERSLDAFPLEFGAILADHTVVAGSSPFAGLTVDPNDLRRACEIQARSHLLHLREGYLETRGRADALAVLIVQSAPAFAALLSSMARLDGRAADETGSAARHVERLLGMTESAISEVSALAVVHDITSADAERLAGPYLDAVDRLVKHVDGWAQ